MLSQNLVSMLGLSWLRLCLNHRWTFLTSQSNCLDNPSRCRESGHFVMDVNTFSRTVLGVARQWTEAAWICKRKAHGLAMNLSNSILTAKIPTASGKAESKCPAFGYSTPGAGSARSAQVTLCGSQNLSFQNHTERAAMITKSGFDLIRNVNPLERERERKKNEGNVSTALSFED